MTHFSLGYFTIVNNLDIMFSFAFFTFFFLYYHFQMDTSTINFQPPSIPRDSEGYVKSFTLSSYDCPEAKEARAFFQEYGFVVIANVFTPEQCEETISDIWNVIESSVSKQVRNDEQLWTSQYMICLYFLCYISLLFKNMVWNRSGARGYYWSC